MQCSRGDPCSFQHDGHERAKPTPKTAPHSEPPTPRGGSASRKRSLKSRSPSGKTIRQPCKNFLKGTCTKLPCDYWHPPECQGCHFVHTILFLTRARRWPSMCRCRWQAVSRKSSHRVLPCGFIEWWTCVSLGFQTNSVPADAFTGFAVRRLCRWRHRRVPQLRGRGVRSGAMLHSLRGLYSHKFSLAASLRFGGTLDVDVTASHRTPCSTRRRLVVYIGRWQSPPCLSFSLLSCWSSASPSWEKYISSCLLRILAQARGFHHIDEQRSPATVESSLH